MQHFLFLSTFSFTFTTTPSFMTHLLLLFYYFSYTSPLYAINCYIIFLSTLPLLSLSFPLNHLYLSYSSTQSYILLWLIYFNLQVSVLGFHKFMDHSFWKIFTAPLLAVFRYYNQVCWAVYALTFSINTWIICNSCSLKSGLYLVLISARIPDVSGTPRDTELIFLRRVICFA